MQPEFGEGADDMKGVARQKVEDFARQEARRQDQFQDARALRELEIKRRLGERRARSAQGGRRALPPVDQGREGHAALPPLHETLPPIGMHLPGGTSAV